MNTRYLPFTAKVAVLAALVCGPMTPSWAQAPAYPSQSIKLIVPYAPGGLPDTVARIVGQRLQERIGQNIVVENRPGGNGSVAVGALNTSPADGYTLMVTDGSMISVTPQLFKQLAYNPKDFVPVVLMAQAPLFLAVHPKVPTGTFKEFVEYVKARPGQVNYGSSGVGSTHHLSMEALKGALQLNMAHVPYRGTGQSVPALLGGHVEVLFSAYPSLSGAVEGNKVKLLATNGAKRSPQAPNLPAIAETIPGFDFAPTIGIFARVGTPPAIVKKIADETIAVVKLPETAKQFAVAGIEPVGVGSDEFSRSLTAEIDRVAKVIQSANIKVEQ